MLFLLACSGTGVYALAIDPPDTNCVAAPDALDGTIRLDYEEDQVHVGPFNETCPVTEGRFVCELAKVDSTSNLDVLSLDAVTTVDIDLTGTFAAGVLSGTIDLVTTCSGADCATVTGGPERCATHWSYTGVRS